VGRHAFQVAERGPTHSEGAHADHAERQRSDRRLLCRTRDQPGARGQQGYRATGRERPGEQPDGEASPPRPHQADDAR
jgi:hypothetical protein